MSRELKGSGKGSKGAYSIDVTDITKDPRTQKITRSKLGKITIQKCSIVWHNLRDTGNNKYSITWDQFIDFMKRHPVK